MKPISIAIASLACAGFLSAADYPVKPVPFTDVSFTSEPIG